MNRRQFLLAGVAARAMKADTEKIPVRVDASRVEGEIHNFWSTSVTTTQDYFTDPERRGSFHNQNPYARYINCVRFLGGIDEKKDDYLRGISPDGEVKTDFAEAVRQIRGILDWGYTPRIVLDNVPLAMSGTDKLNKYGNTLPPKNEDHWHAYVTQLMQSLVKAFGEERVASWRFRVGTEPDLFPGHWGGTEEEYYRHYDYSVHAVTSIIPEAEIGPGNVLDPFDNARSHYPHQRWGHRIIDHCAKGHNFKTGRTGARMNFFACSWYGHVGLPVSLMDDAMRFLRGRLSEHAQFARLPLDIQEFSVLTDYKGRMLNGGEGSEWSASWMAAVADGAYALGLSQLYQWSTTMMGVPVPRTYVLGFLETMSGGGRRLWVTAPQVSPATGRVGCIAAARGGGYDLLLYRHRDELEDGDPVLVEVSLSGAGGGPWRVARTNLVDRDHSGFIRELYKDVEAAGIKAVDKPPGAPMFGVTLRDRYGADGQQYFNTHASRYRELGALVALSPPPALTAGEGKLGIEVPMNGHSVVFVRIERNL